MNKTNKQKKGLTPHQLWRQYGDGMLDFERTKEMVDKGYKAFWERRGMIPPNERRVTWFDRGFKEDK